MKKTGEILKSAREEKGLSLHEIGLALKINAKILKAIEEADEKHLPAKTFLRGFVKSYASYLRLNTDQVLETFAEEMGTTKPQTYIQQNIAPASPQGLTPLQEQARAIEAPLTVTHGEKIRIGSDDPAIKPLSAPSNNKTVAITIVAAVLFGLILFTKSMIDKYSKESEVTEVKVLEPLPDSTTADGSEDVGAPASSEVLPATQSTASTPGLPIVADVIPQPVVPPALSTTSTTTQALATPTPVATPLATPTPVIASTPTPSPSPATNEAQPQKGKVVEIIIEALDTVEIEYSSASGKPNKIKLSPEQVHTFKSKDGLSVQISNGGAVNLIHNGKDLGIPGNLGKPIKLTY